MLFLNFVRSNIFCSMFKNYSNTTTKNTDMYYCTVHILCNILIMTYSMHY